MAIEQEIAKNEYRLDDGWWNVGATKGGTSQLIDFQRGPVVLSLKTLDPRLNTRATTFPTTSASWAPGTSESTAIRPLRCSTSGCLRGTARTPGSRSWSTVGRTNNVQVRITEYPR